MKTLSCPEMNSDLVRGWLDDQLDATRAAEVRQHLRGCPSCFESLMAMTSGNLFALLSGGSAAAVSSFKVQVSGILSQESVKVTTGAAAPLSEQLQRLLAATRELLWEPFVASPIPALGVLSGASRVTVQEVDGQGAPIGSAVVLSAPEHFHTPPVLTNTGRFRFVVHGPDARWVGKHLSCEITLIEDQTISLGASIRATSNPDGWEAAFDREVLTDRTSWTQQDYSIPFDYVKLVVRPARS